MNKQAWMPKVAVVLLIVVMVVVLALDGVRFSAAQSGTPVSGTISVDTTWTKTNSPYNLTGPVAVRTGVILTIQAGVRVNLNRYYIIVNGTLRAVGDSEQIDLKGGNITFTSVSSSWKEQTDSGSIIENSHLDDVYVQSASPKISRNSINDIYVYGGAPSISNNSITNAIVTIKDGSAIFSENAINASVFISGGTPIILNNTIHGQIRVSDGSPLILNNTIEGVISYDQYGRQIDKDYGISFLGGANAYVAGNVISGVFREAGIFIKAGAPIIQRNLISAGLYNIEMSSTATIQNNTISGGRAGILISTGEGSIAYNNIEGGLYSIYLGVANNINATYNWWGTADPKAINQTIHDFKNDFNLGTVNFVPFLTEPNAQAMPNASTVTLPTSSPAVSSTPISPSPSIPLPAFPNESLSLPPYATPSPSPQNSTASPNQIDTQTITQTGLYETVIFVLAGVIVALLTVIIAIRWKCRVATNRIAEKKN